MGKGLEAMTADQRRLVAANVGLVRATIGRLHINGRGHSNVFAGPALVVMHATPRRFLQGGRPAEPAKLKTAEVQERQSAEVQKRSDSRRPVRHHWVGMLLKGLVVASSLGFIAFAALVTVPAPPKPAPKSPLLLTPEEHEQSALLEPVAEPQLQLERPATQPAGRDQRYVVSSRAIRCTADEGCSCGSEEWMWSDGTQLSAEELARVGASVPSP